MWLLLWIGAMVLTIGMIGGVLGALAERASRPSATPFREVVSTFLAGRTVARWTDPGDRIPSHG